MEHSPELLAYLAGALDSDGTVGIRRSTYAMRVVGDARNPTYSERICLKQVTPQIPALLRRSFGGSLMLQAPSVTKGRPLYYWEATNRIASGALLLMRPYLLVKTAQADACLALRASKDLPRAEQRTLRPAALSRTGTGMHAIRRGEVSEVVLAERERLYLLAKELNHVGI
jgi:hypothetical protein